MFLNDILLTEVKTHFRAVFHELEAHVCPAGNAIAAENPPNARLYVQIVQMKNIS